MKLKRKTDLCLRIASCVLAVCALVALFFAPGISILKAKMPFLDPSEKNAVLSFTVSENLFGCSREGTEIFGLSALGLCALILALLSGAFLILTYCKTFVNEHISRSASGGLWVITGIILLSLQNFLNVNPQRVKGFSGVLQAEWGITFVAGLLIAAGALLLVTEIYFLVKKFPSLKAWIYLSPALVLLCIFTVWPIINTLRMAFLEGYSSLKEAGGETFSFGIGNFRKVIAYKNFLTCLKNTVLICVLTVPISTFLALIIAVCLNSIRFLQRFLQTIFFLPYVTNSIAIGMVFAAMFNIVGNMGTSGNDIIVTAGIINNIIEFFGGDPVNWINNGSSYIANITVMVIYIVWNALPFKILILLGGLQNVNKQYYDAAKVDGTSRTRIFTRITVPLLSPMIAYVVITGFIGGFKEYTSIVGVFGENMGPANEAGRLNTMVGFIYDALATSQQGRASAAALILFVIILLITLINLYVSKKKVHY